MNRVHPAIWVGLILTTVALWRVQLEKNRVTSLSSQKQNDPVLRNVYLAESARWALPLVGDSRARLSEALDEAEKLAQTNPQGAQAIAEEVRATLYVTRTGAPPHPDLLERSNQLIVRSLEQRFKLSPSQRETVASKYREFRGPTPAYSLLSSLGFVFWLIGLSWLSLGKREHRVRAVALSASGLVLYLVFLAIA
jgi:hypothetical protein